MKQQRERTCQQDSQLNSNLKPQQIASRVYQMYFDEIKFKQIDYIIGDTPANMQADPKTQLCDIVYLMDECLLYTEKGFDILYNYLLKTVCKSQQSWATRNRAADILVTMNGENQKVYNLKKAALQRINTLKIQQNQQKQINKNEEKLDVKKQLLINSAVIMKFKKTSSCYEYRIWLIEQELKTMDQNQVNAIHNRQNELQKRILDRFPRNYFCWMYRLRFFKLVCSINDGAATSIRELTLIHEMLERSPNDYSILSYYRYLLQHCRQKHFLQAFDLVKQRVNKLFKFCEVAFQEPSSYKNFTDFKKHLVPIDLRQERND